MTIEALAEMVKRGFDATATKDDIRRLETRLDGVDGRLDRLDTRVDHMDARLGRIEADIHDLRDEIVYRHEFEDILDRVKYLEKKLGIDSGVQPGLAS